MDSNETLTNSLNVRNEIPIFRKDNDLIHRKMATTSREMATTLKMDSSGL